VRLPGINLMTLLIKVAGGRELVMVHLGARESHSRSIGRSIPPTGSTSSRFDRSAGQRTKDAIVDRRRLYRIAHAGITRRFAQGFPIGRRLLAVLMDETRSRRLAAFRTSGSRSVAECNARIIVRL
jgi:hypothetical protein